MSNVGREEQRERKVRGIQIRDSERASEREREECGERGMLK